ncbi:MAG: ribbon-helix-helix domain-containing protein [Cyanobacteria bacterium]|nr:ribbon-helix-helix domain-containing protein [Cyanobacteriota bacterium]
MKKKAVKILFCIPELFLSEVDRVAEKEQRTRSELIREALRRYINQNLTRLEPVS